MNDARLRRMQRVLEARERIAEQAELELATATQRALACREASERAQTAWLLALGAADASECTSADLTEGRSYILSLASAYEGCQRAVSAAAAARDASLERLRVARVEVKKIELWRQRLLDSRADDERALERRTMDELAARTPRSA